MNKTAFITEFASSTGRFSPRKQHARLVRNSQTGAPVILDKRTTVRFKSGKGLFRTIN